MTLFDMIVLGALALSGFAGFRKGGIREMLGFVGFTLALLISAYALPWSAPVLRTFIHPDWAGAGAALVAFRRCSRFSTWWCFSACSR